jgi:SAM-dependent methyltransferase
MMSSAKTLHQVTCPACDGPDYRAYLQVDSLNLVQCVRCGLVYTNPQNADRVLERYLNQYDLAQHFGELSARKRILFERRLAELPAPAPGRNRLCDVGCADGQFLELAAARGWQPHGVELNPPAAHRARERGAEVILGRLEELDDLDWGSFDVVTGWDCLEHVPRARVFARRIVELARPGGAILLTTLNRRALVARVFGKRWTMIGEDHFTYWDRGSLSRLLNDVGCSVQEVTSFGLGRDFVRLLDTVASLRAPHPPRVASDVPTARRAARWDVKAPVLAIERLVNRGLAQTGTGVDLYVRGRRG